MARGSIIVRARAPLRLGLAGGGTDLPDYASRFGGVVLNATVDRYAFASIAPRDDGRVVFEACDLGRSETHAAAASLPDSRLALHRGAYERMVRDYNNGAPLAATVTTVVDAPLGSGLGSSSALMVALIEAYRGWLDVPLARHDVARLAFDIERVDLGLSGGQQDQYSAAFGGINYMEFRPDGDVIVNPLRLPDWVAAELESSLAVCFSGQSRASDSIIREQESGMKHDDGAVLDAMHQLRADAERMKRAVLLGDIGQIASILERSWMAKKLTAPGISTARIAALEDVGRAAGAIGAKVSGAGGGGFIMFVVPVERRFGLIAALAEQGAAAHPVKFSERGSETWTVGRK